MRLNGKHGGEKGEEMRKTTFFIAFLLFLPSISGADCTLYLKNGRVFTAPHCWEEGDTIRIEKFGGYISIPRGDIERIDNEKEPYSEGSVPINQKGVTTGDADSFRMNIVTKSWYKSVPVLQKETLIQPQIKFNITNTSDKPISPTIKFVFYEVGTRKKFDDATEYISELMPGDTSESHFARTPMGYIYNGLNLAAIMRQKFDVRIFYRMNFSEWEFLKETYFSTETLD
jgi:hypothetical protein